MVGCQYSADRKRLAETRLQLGLALMQRDRLPAAQHNLAEAERLAPDDYRVLLAQARYQQLLKNQEKARTFYQKALKKSQKNGYLL